MNLHYDVIIIGTGAGGGSLLHRLAGSGKRILILERGPFLPREKDNWSYHGSFKYYSSEIMYNQAGGEIRPGFTYFVGGNTKVYGADLFRLSDKPNTPMGNRITLKLRNFIRCMGRLAKIRLSRGFRRNIRSRRLVTSP